MKATMGTAALTIATLAAVTVSAQPADDLKARVASVKQSLVASQKAIKGDEWIEMTIFSLKGEEKSRLQNRCYHGADGKLQKVPVTAAPEADKPRGLRGKVVESKKAEIGATMEQAKDLIGKYIPPDPARIQASVDAGKSSIQVLEPGKRARLEFRDYLKQGDTLGLELDLVQNRLLKLSVASYLETPEDAVTLGASLGTLEDATSYPAQIVLEATGLGFKTVVENSGYRKLGSQ